MSTTTTITSVSPQKAIAFSSPIPITNPPTRKTMSVTQTYFLAHKARAKLAHQAARPDHDLRLLVGHANLLDTLMLELAEAEREQESWFNQSMRASQQQQQKGQQQQDNGHIQWAPKPTTIVEEAEDEWDVSEDDEDNVSDSSSDAYDEDESEDEDYDDSESSLDEDEVDTIMTDVVRSAANTTVVCSEVDDTSSEEDTIEIEGIEAVEVDAEDDEEDFAGLSLTRSPSHYHHLSAAPDASPISSALPSPPELLVSNLDDELSSDDEADMPPSPVLAIRTFSDESATTDASKPTTTTTSHATPDDDDHPHHHASSYFASPRHPSAIAVY